MEDGHAELSQEEIERRKQAKAPVEEAGGGESEGFEQSEQELIDVAEGDKGHHHPIGDRFTPEETDVRDHTAFGDADQVQSDAREHEND
jgi:hypothetical protein